MPVQQPDFTDADTLGAVRTWLRGAVTAPGGAVCPACTQHAQVYRRVMTSTMAQLLVRFYREHGQEWGHATTLRDGTGDLAKLRHWRLVEESTQQRADGGRAGWWRVTDRGVDFLRRGLTLPARVELYANQLIGYDTAETITIQDALGTGFNLRDLLGDGAGVAPDLAPAGADAAPDTNGPINP